MPSNETKVAERRGRPRLPQDRARSERVVTFLTPPEYAALKELAEASGDSLSATSHRLIATALRQRHCDFPPLQPEH
jgi:hypothetical protein